MFFRKYFVYYHYLFWGGGGGGGFVERVPGGRGDSHKKRRGMLVVPLRGVNFGFWSHLGCSGQNATICSREGLL